MSSPSTTADSSTLQPLAAASSSAAAPLPPTSSSPAAPTAALAPTSSSGDAGEPSISSPHELTEWVECLLDNLQTRFDRMDRAAAERLDEMGKRLDRLEAGVEAMIVAGSGTASGDK